MTIQWTAVAGFLYAESAILFILCLPFISPRRWQRVFQLDVWKKADRYRNSAFITMIVTLVVLFLDAVREVRKYSGSAEEPFGMKDVKLYPAMFDHMHMKLFRAQRNMHISGFALFLWLVLRRVVTLIKQVFEKSAEHDGLLEAHQRLLENVGADSVSTVLRSRKAVIGRPVSREKTD